MDVFDHQGIPGQKSCPVPGKWVISEIILYKLQQKSVKFCIQSHEKVTCTIGKVLKNYMTFKQFFYLLNCFRVMRSQMKSKHVF